MVACLFIIASSSSKGFQLSTGGASHQLSATRYPPGKSSIPALGARGTSARLDGWILLDIGGGWGILRRDCREDLRVGILKQLGSRAQLHGRCQPADQQHGQDSQAVITPNHDKLLKGTATH